MEKYCLENNTLFEIFLIIDNASGHPLFIDDLNPNIKIMFLPLNATNFIQPMDQGDIAAFKLYYQRKTSALSITATEENTEKIMQIWKDYNTYDCIKHLVGAWVMSSRSV